MVSPRTPAATYRIQFNRHFRFTDAQTLATYLKSLGITDLYASPLFKARQESPHGYDVTDPTCLNPELGNEVDFAALTETLQQQGMGLLLDIVPNHMAAGTENPWWLDVLQNGPGSLYAGFFDIEWEPIQPGLSGKVLLPILGKPYRQALKNRELVLEVTEKGIWVRYYKHILPLNTASSARLLAGWLAELARVPGFLDYEYPAQFQLTVLITMLEHMATAEEKTPSFRAFNRAWGVFWGLYNTCPGIKTYTDHQVEIINGKKGDPQSFDHLAEIISGQYYRPAFWQEAGEKINYRRFFDVSDLVSLRMEKEEVFEKTHSLILDLARSGRVTGLRIDHIDGLYDPHAYLARLQMRLSGYPDHPGFYIVTEKILGDNEDLPSDWPVYGTTGYDFLNTLNGIFVYRRGAAELDRLYTSQTGCGEDFTKVVYTQKKRVLAELFPGEMRALAHKLARLAKEVQWEHALTFTGLETSLLEITARLGIYRTYIKDFHVSAPDRFYIEQAVLGALQESPAYGAACKFLRRVLLLEFPERLSLDQRAAWLSFTMRWQQFTGPVMAKGSEDTALYIYNRLLSANEVGGHPDTAGIPVEEFHRCNKERRERWPCTLNTTSTHDTKRSEDVRARINVLSEIPAAWARRVERWRKWNDCHKTLVNGRPAPDANTELFIYQTLVGAWPLQEENMAEFDDRLQSYLVKAAREAKVHTSWLNPDASFESALQNFVTNILLDREGNLFYQDFKEFQQVTAYFGALNSLGQTLMKITSPGIPDFYQGCELWNFSLVDPDNRRPVDFKTRARLLAQLEEEDEKSSRRKLTKKLFSCWQDGRIKLYLTYKALNFRRERQDLFTLGEYIPLASTGPGQEHACSFARRLENRWVLSIVSLFPAMLQLPCRSECCANELPPTSLPGESSWGNSGLIMPEHSPEGWLSVFTGETLKTHRANGKKVLPLFELLESLPVALLVSE